jgi:hypothetical protein
MYLPSSAAKEAWYQQLWAAAAPDGPAAAAMAVAATFPRYAAAAAAAAAAVSGGEDEGKRGECALLNALLTRVFFDVRRHPRVLEQMRVKLQVHRPVAPSAAAHTGCMQ